MPLSPASATRIALLLLGLAAPVGAAAPARAGDLPEDPAGSVMWADMAARHFTGGPIRFDPRVKVIAPAHAEDQFQVPVTVDASALPGVVEIVVVADLNPIQHVLTFAPEEAEAYLSFRIKVEQTTAVRAGARLADGSWAMGVAVVDAAGGGCSAPAGQRQDVAWQKRLGETRARIARTDDGTARMTVRMRHPMDTGLANGIPAFFLERMKLTTPDGRALGDLRLHEPVSENPTVTFRSKLPASTPRIDVKARDSEGNDYGFSVPAPFKASAAPATTRVE